MPQLREDLQVMLRVPDLGSIHVGELSTEVRQALKHAPRPFSADVIDFCSEFSIRLFRDPEARTSGELQSLAFFMRRANLQRMEARFKSLERPEAMLAPRGVALHIPPANVSAILAYSWLVSVLTGNVNIIRLPSSTTKEHNILARIFNELICEACESLRRNTYIVQYGHQEEISAALSAMADIRVIWGGDDTVRRLRSVPLPPGSKELTFPDKHSLGLISVSHYAAADDVVRDRLAAGFFNDTYWFDQMACSSPRLLVWHGSPSLAREASLDFFTRVRNQIDQHNYQSNVNAALTKEAFSYAAILDQGVTEYRRLSNELTVLTVDKLDNLTREHCGGGLLFQYFAADLEPLKAFVTRRDQTLSYFDYSGPELVAIATELRGCGIDRLVPIGQALEFQTTWDGYDLLQEFCRRISIETSDKGAVMIA